MQVVSKGVDGTGREERFHFRKVGKDLLHSWPL